MKRKMVALLMTVIMAGSLLAGCGGSGEKTSGAEDTEQDSTAQNGDEPEMAQTETSKSAYGDVTANEEYNFQIIVKSMSSDFWRAATEGAEDEAAALGVNVTVIGPAEQCN